MISYYRTVTSTIRMSLPMILISMANGFSGIVCMYLISRLGQRELAAGALISSTYSLLSTLIVAWMFSVGAVVGQRFGAGRFAEIGYIVVDGLRLATLLSVPILVLIWNVEPILLWLQQPPATVALVKIYFHGLFFGFLPMVWNVVYNQFLLAIGKPRLMVINSSLILLGNFFLGDALMEGKWGLPQLGISGVAFSIAFLSYFVFTYMTILFLRYNNFDAYHLKEAFRSLLQPERWLAKVQPTFLSTLCKMGWPISVQYGAELGAFATATYLISLFGMDALAAQQITMQATTMMVMFTVGIGQATTILISHANGRGDRFMAQRQCWVGVFMVVLVLAVVVQWFWWNPRPVVALFVDLSDQNNLNILKLSTTLLLVVGFIQLVDSARNVITGALRGYNDTQIPMWIGLLGCWGISIPVGILFGFGLHWGAQGIRLGFGVGISIALLLLIYRFIRISRQEFVPV